MNGWLDFDARAAAAGSKNTDACAVVEFLETPRAKPIFERQGFAVLP